MASSDVIRRRFACGLGSAWLLATGAAFAIGAYPAGYVLGGLLTALATLVAVTRICLPSLLYRAVSTGRPSAAAVGSGAGR